MTDHFLRELEEDLAKWENSDTSTIGRLVRMVKVLRQCLEDELAYASEDMREVKMLREQTMMGRALSECDKIAGEK